MPNRLGDRPYRGRIMPAVDKIVVGSLRVAKLWRTILAGLYTMAADEMVHSPAHYTKGRFEIDVIEDVIRDAPDRTWYARNTLSTCLECGSKRIRTRTHQSSLVSQPFLTHLEQSGRSNFTNNRTHLRFSMILWHEPLHCFVKDLFRQLC